MKVLFVQCMSPQLARTDQARCLLSSRYRGGKRTHCGHAATAVFDVVDGARSRH